MSKTRAANEHLKRRKARSRYSERADTQRRATALDDFVVRSRFIVALIRAFLAAS